jgi:hypothetical protein
MESTEERSNLVPFPSREPRATVESAGDRMSPPLRDVIGDVLREERTRQERTLADVASDAAVSLPYLSEVERGRKDVSSDLLDAIARALDLELVDVLERSVRRLQIGPQRQTGIQLLAA